MKRIFIYTVVLGFLFIFYGCPIIPFTPNKCYYEYPINIKNLHSTIKITDTLWVENDFDPRFCLEEGIAKGCLTESPNIKKLINDTLVLCTNVIVNHNAVIASNGTYYLIEVPLQNGRYQLKYGIVFPDTGIYLLSTDIVGVYTRGTQIILCPYFDTPSNNSYLLPEKLQCYGYTEKPYRAYFITVVE